jgi:hypothetical protein
MQLTLRFFGPLRQYTDTDSTPVNVDPEASVNDVVAAFAAQADERLRALLVDESGCLRRHILPVVRDAVIDPGEPGCLAENDEIVFHSALAGG